MTKGGGPGCKAVFKPSVVEEAQVGMNQGDAQLIAGINDHLVSSGARGRCYVFHSTLDRKEFTVDLQCSAASPLRTLRKKPKEKEG